MSTTKSERLRQSQNFSRKNLLLYSTRLKEPELPFILAKDTTRAIRAKVLRTLTVTIGPIVCIVTLYRAYDGNRCRRNVQYCLEEVEIRLQRRSTYCVWHDKNVLMLNVESIYYVHEVCIKFATLFLQNKERAFPVL